MSEEERVAKGMPGEAPLLDTPLLDTPLLDSPLQPEDFTMEGPYMVFTAAYHLKRGYCCNSDCRHCPYK